jgi:hypothetical protein
MPPCLALVRFEWQGYRGECFARSPLAPRRDFADTLIAWIELRAQRNGRHAEPKERQVCQALAGVTQNNGLPSRAEQIVDIENL